MIITIIIPLIDSTEIREQTMCGLTACQALDLSRQNTERTMVKMMRTIKPEALEQVFQNMDKVEMLIRKVQDLNKEVDSLYAPSKNIIISIH